GKGVMDLPQVVDVCLGVVPAPSCTAHQVRLPEQPVTHVLIQVRQVQGEPYFLTLGPIQGVIDTLPAHGWLLRPRLVPHSMHHSFTSTLIPPTRSSTTITRSLPDIRRCRRAVHTTREHRSWAMNGHFVDALGPAVLGGTVTASAASRATAFGVRLSLRGGPF